MSDQAQEHCTWANTEAGRPECPNEREVKIILHGRYVAALCAQHTAEIVPVLVKKYKTVQTWPYKEKPKDADNSGTA